MTKRNLLFVSLLLVFGLCAMAPSLFAQGTVWGASSNQNTIRTEGDAEAVGTITLTTTSTGTIESSSGFTILYNLPIAYYGKIYAIGFSCSGPDYTAICAAISTPIVATGTGASAGKVVQLTFNNTSPIPIAGTPGHADAINVAVRVKSQGVAVGTGLTGTITAFYKFGNQSLTLATTTGSIIEGLGSVDGPALTIGYTPGRDSGPEYILTCIGVHDVEGTIYNNDFSIRLTENWNDALTSLSDEYSLENNDSSSHAGMTSPTYPTNGSNILITLSGLPTGTPTGSVGVVAGLPIPCNGTNPSASNYCANGQLTIGPGIDTSATAPYGPTVAFWYPVLTTNVQAIEFADFGFKLWSTGPIQPGTTPNSITLTVQLTDNYPNTVTTPPPNGDMPWFSLPETPTVTVAYLFDCVTKLLFPYINTFGSSAATSAGAFTTFGTGIVISNTTWDPFALPGPYGGYLYPDEAKGTATPQSGSCTFYFYPSDESATTYYTDPRTVSAGGQIQFDVAAATSKYSTVPFVNKQGYAIAVCGFQNAHGFAEIYDNYPNLGTSGPHTILGYVPEVLPDPAFYHRSPAGDGLGEGAVAPINIERHLLKELMGIVHH